MYHFIGIKGSGMSSLACVMKNLGYEVQGSDIEKHFFTEECLTQNNIPILTYDKNNINEHMKIIKGASITDDNQELIRAIELNLNIISYNEMVGFLTKKFETICIAGCHGKTTTTAMMSFVLDNLKGCNYLIGDGTGHAAKENTLFVLEACEYKRHFLEYSPKYAIITNIDLDHIDYYKNIDDVIDAYQEYANKASKMIIACGDDPYTHSLELNRPIFYYGVDEDNDIIAKNIDYKIDGTSFEVIIEDNYYGYFDLPIYGKHQLLDALAVIAICYYERLDAKEVSHIFKKFKGAKRRFSEIVINDCIIIDDYAHHPNEVKATLKAVKQKYPNKKVVTVFEPHTFSRTKEFSDDFINVFNTVDEAYILDIYPSREKQEDFIDVTSNIIIDNLDNAHHINREEAYKLKNYKNTVFVFMSPNDIKTLEQDLIRLKEEQNEL